MSLFKRERLAEMARETPAVPTHSVMIVDDEEGNLRVLRVVLGERFRVHEAVDGQAALELLQSLPPEQAPCVILSDQRMPRMTGVELFEKVRDLLPDSIRIIITGFVDVGAIVDAINRAGIYKFVVKPFDRNDLLITVERAIEAYEMRRKIAEYIHQLEDKVRERTQELEQKNAALQQAYGEIERASLTDPLTGLGNRRYLSREQSSHRANGERRRNEGHRTAYMLIDLDHFKSVNDGYGHAAGDAVLARMGEILRAHLREGDIAVRWGGEEFLLRAEVGDEGEALACAERLRHAVEAAQFLLPDGQVLQRTCSIGIACQPFVASQPERLDWERILNIADAALYMAKRGGRNEAVVLSACASLPDDFEQRLDSDLEGLISSGVLARRGSRQALPA